MMTTAEILNEIHRLPINQQKELKEKILEDLESNGMAKPPTTQETFDQMLLEDGFLADIPVEIEDADDFEPVAFTGRPISETIIEERR
jgi:hypothetical protein